MRTIDISETDAEIFSALHEIEKSGKMFIICRNGRPIADLIPHKKKRKIIPHHLARKIEINYDPVEPLSRDEWPEG